MTAIDVIWQLLLEDPVLHSSICHRDGTTVNVHIKLRTGYGSVENKGKYELYAEHEILGRI